MPCNCAHRFIGGYLCEHPDNCQRFVGTQFEKWINATPPEAPSMTTPQAETEALRRPCDDKQLEDALYEAIAKARTSDAKRIDTIIGPTSIQNIVLQITEGSTILDDLIERHITTLRAHVAALEAALMAIRGKASELVEFYASGVSKEIANLADAALKGGAAT